MTLPSRQHVRCRLSIRRIFSLCSLFILAQWTQYYSAREVYGAAIPGGWPATTPLTPAFWHKVTEAFERDDNLFKKYLEFKNRGINVETCAPGACKDQALCQLRAGRSESNCVSEVYLFALGGGLI